WSSQEEAILHDTVAECGTNWLTVAKHLPGRSPNSCRSRWYSSVDTTMTRKGRWSEREKQRLNELVSKYGFLWTAIAYQLKTRTATQCRDQWRSTLMPGIKLGHWTEEEDALLRQGVKKYKRRWKLVAAMVPGRTARQCCARWD
ncbi:Homeodomain-like protein, partial [Syncephalis fuscata]